MNSRRLTKTKALLLQRYVDEELSAGEREAAEQLLEKSTAARVYVSALKDLRQAVHLAEQQAWRQASLSPPEKWLELAEASSQFSDASLDDLAPLLERFHDGEVDDAEAAVVASLIDERDDVARYLAELERMSAGLQKIGGDVTREADFQGFFEEMTDELDRIDADRRGPVAVESFDADRHAELLMRYYDGEAEADEKRRVKSWLDADDGDVARRLSALDEIHRGVKAAVTTAVEDAEFGNLEEAIGPELDAIDAERAADNVVSLAEASDQATDKGRNGAEPVWNKPVFAAAVAVALLVTGALVGPQIWQQDDEPESQTVVIFDNIESAPGSSVELHTPEFADHNLEDEGADFGAEPGEPQIGPDNGEEEPTVLWLIEDDDDPEDDDPDPEDETDELPGPI